MRLVLTNCSFHLAFYTSLENTVRIFCGMDFTIGLNKTAFLLIIFGNRRRWNRGIVNEMQHFWGIGRTGRVFQLFHVFHLSEWNSWNSKNSWNSGHRIRMTLDFYSEIE